MTYDIGIVDDHCLFLKSLSRMISETFEQFSVTLEAGSCIEMQLKLRSMTKLPDIILLDVNMPEISGLETATWLTQHHPGIKLAALSMNDTDKVILDMIREGCCSYLLKDTHPTELELALLEIAVKGFCNADSSNINFRKLILSIRNDAEITERERRFLPFACTDLTYKEIAAIMGVTERTVDGYRESLFVKLNVLSRTGLAMEAVRRRLVDV